DAHSPEKIAREANIFNTELSYKAMKDAIIDGDKNRFSGTIEFFPEEGKYHFDGHRTCRTRMSPDETKENNTLCPVCKRKVTVGVMHRVDLLADREDGFMPEDSPTYKSLIPLSEIISEVIDVGVKSKAVEREYMKLVNSLGNELKILQDVSIDKIKTVSSARIGEGIERVRKGDISIAPGYDGEYGSIKVFGSDEKKDSDSQMKLF
ncbi:MAG: endonuclease Q family protein, partial [Thermodesulfobacteriota bacterium]